MLAAKYPLLAANERNKARKQPSDQVLSLKFS